MTSNLTPEELAAAVAKIAALDEKRYQDDEWTWREEDGGFAIVPLKHRKGASYSRLAYAGRVQERDFLTTAPLMARIIRQLWAEREANRTVMQQARDALNEADDLAYSTGHHVELQKPNSDCGDCIRGRRISEALAALDAVLKGGVSDGAKPAANT